MKIADIGVKKNLWRTEQGILLRRNFPIDGLVLYYPLWHPELNGSTIISKDLNALSATVTGATHGLQGRTFNGTSDRIAIAANALFKVANFTCECWYKPSSVPASVRTLLSTTVGDTGVSLNINQDGAGAVDAGKVSIWFYDTAWRAVATVGDVLVADTWIHIRATYNSTTLALYINDALNNSAAQTGTIAYAASTPFSIGSDNVPAQYAPGIIGDVFLYEGVHNWSSYQKTKGKY